MNPPSGVLRKEGGGWRTNLIGVARLRVVCPWELPKWGVTASVQLTYKRGTSCSTLYLSPSPITTPIPTMHTPEPSFPSFSLVLSQSSASPNHSFLVFPWTSIDYQHPVVVPPAPLAVRPFSSCIFYRRLIMINRLSQPPPPPVHVQHVPHMRRVMSAIRVRFLSSQVLPGLPTYSSTLLQCFVAAIVAKLRARLTA